MNTNYNRAIRDVEAFMRIGRFFSLQKGRVGQYLSTRVLVVRLPFRRSAGDVCYFGFDRLNQAQTFAQHLATMGCNFQLRRSQMMPQGYEIRLHGHTELARTLAYWDRLDDRRLGSATGFDRRPNIAVPKPVLTNDSTQLAA